jgi:hypothetical protein
MKRAIRIGIALSLGVSTPAAQSTTTEPQSPKQVVERFVKMETNGERLTPDGWREASVFFVRPSPFPQHPRIFVIGDNFLVWDPVISIADNKAEVPVEVDPQGQIDGHLRFAPPSRRFFKTSAYFHLVFTDKHWRLGPQGDPNEELTGPSRWLISSPNDTVILTLSAAIRYVSRQRRENTDLTIKRNADLTLTKLKALHH